MDTSREALRTRYRPRLLDRERLLGWLMLSPALGYVLLLIGVPFGLAIYLSFTNAISGNLSASFVGLKNFRDIIVDPIFQQALANTFIFTFVSQLIVLILATALAITLSKRFVGKPLVRFLILLPWVAPVALTTRAWAWILDPTFSTINWTLKALGLLPGNAWIYWTGFTNSAMATIILIHVWRMLPFATVILLAGLTSIPQDLQDAATVDGARFWRRLFAITIPLMLPIVTVAVLFGIVFTFTDMTVVYLLTQGGPYNSTHVLASLAFYRGILSGDLGQGAAIALFMLPVLAVVAVLLLRVARRTEVA